MLYMHVHWEWQYSMYLYYTHILCTKTQLLYYYTLYVLKELTNTYTYHCARTDRVDKEVVDAETKEERLADIFVREVLLSAQILTCVCGMELDQQHSHITKQEPKPKAGSYDHVTTPLIFSNCVNSLIGRELSSHTHTHTHTEPTLCRVSKHTVHYVMVTLSNTTLPFAPIKDAHRRRLQYSTCTHKHKYTRIFIIRQVQGRREKTFSKFPSPCVFACLCITTYLRHADQLDVQFSSYYMQIQNYITVSYYS